MRYWLISLVMVALVCMGGSAQEVKKKGKEADKEAEPKKIVITEIAGKNFGHWAKEINSKDPSKSEVAIKTILNFGPDKAYEVVPDIIARLKKHPKFKVDLSFRVNGTLVLSTIFQHKKDPDPKYLKDSIAIFKSSIKDSQAILKIRTMQALPNLGYIAREALPEVIESINDPTSWETRHVAVQTLQILASYDQKAAPPAKSMETLNGVLQTDEKGQPYEHSAIVRHDALQAIPPVGDNMTNATLRSQLISRMNSMASKDEDDTVKIQAHLSLIFFQHHYVMGSGPLPTSVKTTHFDPMVTFTKNFDPITRIHALQAIGTLGEAAQVATPQVISAIDDSDNNVAANAMIALIRMKAYSALPALQRLKNDKTVSEVLREAADDTIEQLEFVRKQDEQRAKTPAKGDKK